MESKLDRMLAKKLSQISDESFNEIVEGEIFRVELDQIGDGKWCVIYLVDADEGMICITLPEYVSQLEIKKGQTIRIRGQVQYHPKWKELILWTQEIEHIPSNSDWKKGHEKLVDNILAHANIDLCAMKTKKINHEKAFGVVRDYFYDLGINCRNAYFIMLIEALVQRNNNLYTRKNKG